MMLLIAVICSVVGYASAIVNGQPTDRGEYPYMATVQEELFLIADHRCGGMLIHPEWVLTAAHCIRNNDPSEYDVILGVYDLDNIGGELQEQEFESDQLIIHEDYAGGGAQTHDIALIQLSGEADISGNWVKLIPLAPTGASYVGQNCTIVGWGNNQLEEPSDAMDEGFAVIRTTADCNAAWTNLNITDNNMCIGGQDADSGTAMCTGDGGGPLECTVEGQKVVVGIASFGALPCTNAPSLPSVYTDISKYRAWICTNTNGAVCP